MYIHAILDEQIAVKIEYIVLYNLSYIESYRVALFIVLWQIKINIKNNVIDFKKYLKTIS